MADPQNAMASPRDIVMDQARNMSRNSMNFSPLGLYLGLMPFWPGRAFPNVMANRLSAGPQDSIPTITGGRPTAPFGSQDIAENAMGMNTPASFGEMIPPKMAPANENAMGMVQPKGAPSNAMQRYADRVAQSLDPRDRDLFRQRVDAATEGGRLSPQEIDALGMELTLQRTRQAPWNDPGRPLALTLPAILAAAQGDVDGWDASVTPETAARFAVPQLATSQLVSNTRDLSGRMADARRGIESELNPASIPPMVSPGAAYGMRRAFNAMATS